MHTITHALECSFTTQYAPMHHYVLALWPTMPDGTWQVVDGDLITNREGFIYLVNHIVLAEALVEYNPERLTFQAMGNIKLAAHRRAHSIIAANWP